MTPAQRREGRVSFAMLPIGLMLTVAAVVGIAAVLALAVAEVTGPDENWLCYVGWCAFAAALGFRNLIRSLRTMSALDVRGTFVTIALSAVIVAAYPGWWLS